MSNIKSIIKNTGKISIADFMEEVMFNPIKGYYKTKDPIGKNSDFITAPEISSIFSQLVASYILSVIINKNSNKKVVLVEMGAGKGTMFNDMVSTIKKFQKTNPDNKIAVNIDFAIIEINPELQKVQKNTLSAIENISWYSDFEDFEKRHSNHEIYFVANELFDCFAINQFSRSQGRWQEIMVAIDKEDSTTPTLEEFSPQKHQLIKTIAQNNLVTDSDHDIIFEHSFKASRFMKQLSLLIKKNSGMVIIVDYGYTKPPEKSTLQAIKDHKKVDIFKVENPYDCDLTSLVNFHNLESIAKNSNLSSSLISQREFLTSLGINDKLEQLTKSTTEQESQNLKLAIQRLIDKEQMGELFKCLIIWQE